MKTNLATFQGSLGRLVRTLKEYPCNQRTAAAIRVFPETGLNRTISGDSLDSLCEYNKCPDIRKKLLKEGRVWFNVPFFDKDIPMLIREVYSLLYPADKAEVENTKKALEQFYKALKKIRQYYNRSLRGEGDRTFANEDIAQVIRDFWSSVAYKRLKNWIIGGCSPDIGKIDDFILRAESWLSMLSRSKKKGRPVKRFNILVFHVVNQFTRRAFTAKREYIMKGAKFRVRKNWQLICAALLWLHIQEDIPEMRAFIKAHENEEAGSALEKLKVFLKKDYQHFQRSGKGDGKWAKAFQDGSEYLDISYAYLAENGLKGRLV